MNKIDFDNLITIKEIGLYLNDELVTNLDDFSQLEFSSLLSNTLYEIRVVYEYDLNDGNGIVEKEISKEVKTEAKEAPSIDFTRVSEPLNGTEGLEYELINDGTAYRRQ